MVSTALPRNTRIRILEANEPNSPVDSGPTVPSPFFARMTRMAIRRPIRRSSRKRLRTAADLLRRGRRGFLRARSRVGERGEARRQLRHDPRAFGRREIAPAPDLIERAAAADAEAQARMHHTNLIARRFDVGFGAGHERSRLESRGTIDSNWLAAKR